MRSPELNEIHTLTASSLAQVQQGERRAECSFRPLQKTVQALRAQRATMREASLESLIVRRMLLLAKGEQVDKQPCGQG